MGINQLRLLFAIAIVSSISSSVRAQPAMASASDPAQQFNIITRDKFSNSYTLIGGYKVKGNPYLFGGQNDGAVTSRGENAISGKIAYNTYSQQVELVTGNENNTAVIKDFQTIDSFNLDISNDLYKGNMKFYNANRWDAKNKFFLQEVLKAGRYILLKKFFSTLEVVSSNYIQSELRQFELNSEYYYVDTSKNVLTKLKVNENGLKKEFSADKDCIAKLDYTNILIDKENFLRAFFQTIANCKSSQ